VFHRPLYLQITPRWSVPIGRPRKNLRGQSAGTRLFTGRMLFLLPNLQRRSTEGKTARQLERHWKLDGKLFLACNLDLWPFIVPEKYTL